MSIAAPIQSIASLTAPQPPARTINKELGKDEFLKLLVAQLANQDPSNPSDGKEMAAQLAQFSSVEQLIQINGTLAEQQASYDAVLAGMNDSVALSTIGRQVTAVSDQVLIGDSGTETTVSFKVGGTGGEATLTLLDANGAVVGTRALGPLDAGTHRLELGDAAKGLPAGTYRYRVEVTNSAGTAVPVETYVTGVVDGLTYDASGARLSVGGHTVRIGDIIAIAAAPPAA